jgi:hypothetical protein
VIWSAARIEVMPTSAMIVIVIAVGHHLGRGHQPIAEITLDDHPQFAALRACGSLALDFAEATSSPERNQACPSAA